MNGNKKSAKQYHQSVITALEKKVNDIDEYLWDTYPKLTYFTDWFDIQKLEYNYVFQDGVKYRVEKKIVLKDE